MSEYFNEFDEVCITGSRTSLTNRPATDLELEQRDEISRFEEGYSKLEDINSDLLWALQMCEAEKLMLTPGCVKAVEAAIKATTGKAGE